METKQEMKMMNKDDIKNKGTENDIISFSDFIIF
jgi:hypothetical protein